MNWTVPDKLETDFISGFTFYKKSRYNLCPRYKQSIAMDIGEEEIIFINLDHYQQFCQFVKQNNLNNKFTILTHNSDRDFTKEMFFLLEKNIKKVYAINCTFQHENVIKIPLGFNDQSTAVLDSKNLSFIKKDRLVYLNFKKHHHNDRVTCFNYFSQFDWVDKEESVLSYSDFYDKLNTYKYCISPRGTGIDTHRLYESILFGVIPIVKTSDLDDLYEKLPILLVNDWNEITQKFLIENYNTLLEKLLKWRDENKTWFLPDFWIKNNN